MAEGASPVVGGGELWANRRFVQALCEQGGISPPHRVHASENLGATRVKRRCPALRQTRSVTRTPSSGHPVRRIGKTTDTMNNDVRQRSVPHNLGIRRSCVSSGFVGAEGLGGVLRGRMLCHLDDAAGRPVACTRRNKTWRASPSRVIRTPGILVRFQRPTRRNANRNAR